MIKSQQDGEDFIPLYHIYSLENIAYLLSKAHPVRSSDIQTMSEWHIGLKWVTLSSKNLPCNLLLHIPEDFTEIYNEETFQEVKSFHTDPSNEARTFLITHLDLDPDPPDPTIRMYAPTSNFVRDTWYMFKFKFKELGWERARNQMRLVLKACHIFAHGWHKLASALWMRCYKC